MDGDTNTATGPAPTAADLVLARDRLLRPVTGHLAPDALREALADLHEFWLTAHAAQAGVGGRGQGVALVAVGGLGRRELVPYSDLDLLLVHDGSVAVEPIAERLWYPLWNSGVGLDHSVRTVGEALEVASTDLRTATGLLDGRHLAGDHEVSARLISSARARWRAEVRARIGELADSARQRWERTGEVAHWVEPDLKHGKGGLRDFGLLTALSAGQLVDRPADDVAKAHTLLLDTRTELRRIAGRPRDVLRPQDGDEIAAALALGDRFSLARALSGAGRTISYALEVALRASGLGAPRRVFGVLRRAPQRRPLDEGVVLHGTEVALARDARPAKDPGLLLRVAAAAARTGNAIGQGALAALADAAPEPRQPWTADLRQELVALLGAGPALVDVVEALDHSGLWARLFPEWGAVRDLPPRDASHTWTVDRHLVQTTAHAGALATSVARPDLLLIGALLHDIGKGRDTDHSVVGAALATQAGRRMGLSAADVDTLSAMVRHHLLLPHTATRRDVEDEATVLRVVDTLGGDPVLLELLHALTIADSLATGPGVWSDWKAALVADLVGRCGRAMAGERIGGPEPLEPAQRSLAESVAESGRPDLLVDRGQECIGVTLTAPDQRGLLSRAAGVLALNSIEVHSADARTHAGTAVLVFSVSPRFGSLPATALLREQFTRAFTGSLPLRERLAAKERDYGGLPFGAPEPRVLWFDHEAGGTTSPAVVLELRAADRIGLLHDVTTALEHVGAEVLWARIATLGATAIDSFSLVVEGGRTPDPGRRRLIERTVLDAAR